MNRQQAIDYIKAHPEHYLTKARVRGYVCPLCGNGSGASGTGLEVRDGEHFKCFKCGFYGDMVQLIAEDRGIKDGGSREAFDAAIKAYKLDVDNTDYTHNEYNKHETHKAPAKPEKEDYKAFIKQAAGENCDYSYLQARGISRETAALLQFGYDPKEKAVVIPESLDGKWSYEYRFTGERKDGMKHKRPKGRWSGLFNEAALDQDEMPVVITESATDAASIVEIRGQAIGMNSANNVRLLLERIERGCACSRFIIYTDNDEAGKAAEKTLAEGLKRLEKQFLIMEAIEGCKDANEALMMDRKTFTEACVKAMQGFTTEEKPKSRIDRHKVSSLIESFAHYINDAGSHKPIPTGFEGFDKVIGGGLYPRTYVIGAMTTLGKTTFVLQAADGVAKAGGDVIIFSLEMMMEELIARSISRETYESVMMQPNMQALARSEQDVLELSRRSYSLEQQQVIWEAIKRYNSYAGEHISIYEGKQTADSIKEIAEEYVRQTGRVPVIIVDYLQKLQPNTEYMRAQIRQQVDYNMSVFADMRRELKTPVIIISSFNRSGNKGVATGSSFKESGEIEYTGDCVISMELDEDVYKFTDDNEGNNNANKRATIKALGNYQRSIKLTFHKNRGNRAGSELRYTYTPQYNYFMEQME